MAVRSDIYVNFDASPRIIWIQAPTTSVTIQDLLDTIRVLEAENLVYKKLANGAGKTFLYNDGFSDYFTGIVLTLQDAQIAFEARSGPGYTQCQINAGDLVAQDSAGLPVSPVLPTAFTQVLIAQSTAPTLVTTSNGIGSAAQVADAVWDATMASHLTPGSTGRKLNDAGAGALTQDQTTMLLEMYTLLGLDPTKPLIVTETSRTAGTIDQTIATSPTDTIVTRN